jgi:hypothetical protein
MAYMSIAGQCDRELRTALHMADSESRKFIHQARGGATLRSAFKYAEKIQQIRKTQQLINAV